MNSIKRQLFLLVREERRLGRGLREENVRGEGSTDRQSALDREQIFPTRQRSALDLKRPVREESTKGTGDIRRRVEDGEATGEFPAAVELGLVVDDQREEGALGHSEEPAESDETGPVVGCGDEESHGAEGEHHQGEDAGGAVDFSQDAEEGGGEDVGDEEDGEEDVV